MENQIIMKEYLNKSWKYYIILMIIGIIISYADRIINTLDNIFITLTNRFSDEVQLTLAITMYLVFLTLAYIIAVILDRKVEKCNEKLN